jgi:hypothetical protein
VKVDEKTEKPSLGRHRTWRDRLHLGIDMDGVLSIVPG